MSCNIGNNRIIFRKLNSKLRFYHVVLETPKTFTKKLTLTLVEMEQLKHIEKTVSKEEVSCVKWIIFIDRGKSVCKLPN